MFNLVHIYIHGSLFTIHKYEKYRYMKKSKKKKKNLIYYTIKFKVLKCLCLYLERPNGVAIK